MNKILIIGFGSIGERHFKILNKIVEDIKIITNRKIKNLNIIKFTFSDILKYNPDYIIISSSTENHYKHLKKINKIVSNKVILIEKPLFAKKIKNNIALNNKVFVGFNMRFNPIIIYLKKYFSQKNKIALTVNLYCGSYLPNWRKNIPYSKSSSASATGGGVIKDLSHEIDFLSWIFGDIKIKNIDSLKLSNLKIQSKDFANISGFCKKTYFNMMLNYFSRLDHRYLIIDCNNETIHVDLISKNIRIFKDKNARTISLKFHRNKSYELMHESILKNDFSNLCSYNQAIKYLKIYG